MPNQITAAGLETKTTDEIVTGLDASFRTIYGADINLASNTPDGQIIGIFAQEVSDVLDLVTQVYAMFDPDQAIGVTLDFRCAINGIKRKPATFSTTDISIVTTSSCNLIGLDGKPAPDGTEFIVQDNGGTKWILLNSYSISGATTTILVFQAVDAGAILTAANTITIPVSVVLGVASVNNPAAQLTTGQNEEQDGALRLRRQKSVALSSSGFYDALLAALLNIPDVTSAAIYENTTGSTDGDGIPGHSIWVIVAGGTDADIAQAIYAKRNAGCGMYGSISYTITRLNGAPFVISWDVVSSEELYMKFKLDALSGNITTTATIPAAGASTLTGVSSVTGMTIGNPIRGTGIQPNTFITAIGTTTIGISRVTTGGGSTGTITVVPIVADPAIAGSLPDLIAQNLNPQVYEQININQISTLVQSLNSNALVTFASGTQGLSADNSTFTFTLLPATKAKQFSVLAADITVL